MIACREAVDRLWTYLDRSLDRTREEERAHLGLCACRRARVQKQEPR
jgi:hypothetical protein